MRSGDALRAAEAGGAAAPEIARDRLRRAADGSLVHRDGDYSVTALAFAGRVRAFACRSTAAVAAARAAHDLSPLATVALGRLLSAAHLMAKDLKAEFSDLSLSVKGEGPLGGAFALADAAGRVRGYVLQPRVETQYIRPGKLNVGAALGAGTLSVVKRSAAGGQYSSQVELLSGEIAEDVNYYLALSEQIASVVALGVGLDRAGVSAAGGLIVQLMPGADEALSSYLEARAAGFPDLSGLLNEGFDPAELIDLFLGDPELEYLATGPLTYFCPCSAEEMKARLLTLDAEALAELAEDARGIRAQCQYCARDYHFAQAELKAWLAARERRPEGAQRRPDAAEGAENKGIM